MFSEMHSVIKWTPSASVMVLPYRHYFLHLAYLHFSLLNTAEISDAVVYFLI